MEDLTMKKETETKTTYISERCNSRDDFLDDQELPYAHEDPKKVEKHERLHLLADKLNKILQEEGLIFRNDLRFESGYLFRVTQDNGLSLTRDLCPVSYINANFPKEK